MRRVVRWLRARMPVLPKSYWRQRHALRAGSLAAAGHADLSEEDNAADYAERRARLADALRPLAPRPGETKRLLDAGCGTGLMFGTWRELGFEVTGMDFASPEALAGQSRDGVPVILGDICEIPERPQVDVIACIDVLFHVLSDRRWRRFLETAGRALAPEGRLVIQEQLVEESAYAGVQRHCHFRCLSHYERAAQRAGLVIDARSHYALPRSGVREDVLVFARLT